jgi:PAS domain S-box-containing protein
MAKKTEGPKKSTALRQRAVARLVATRRDVAAMPVTDVQKLVHELQVHQIELEMQNDELRRTQAELEAARDRYVDLYDFAPTGHLTLDKRGTIVEANLRVATMLGVGRNKLLGQPLVRFIAEVSQDTLRRHCQDVLNTGRRQICEVQLRNQAGALCWVNLESLAVQDEPGRMICWRTSLLDISHRKQAEQALLEKEQLFRIFLDHAPNLAFVKGTDGRYLYVNSRFEEVFQFDRGSALGKSDVEIFSRDQAEQFQANDRKVLESGQTREFEETALHRDGLHTSIVVKFPLKNKAGQIYAIGGIVTDITDRKQIETALQDSEERMRAFLDNSATVAWMKDAEGRYVYISPSMERRFGVRLEDWRGKTDSALWPREMAEKFRADDRTVLNENRVLETVEEARTSDGSSSWWLTHKFPYQLPSGDRCVGGLAVEVTDRKKIEGELHKLNAELLRAKERWDWVLRATQDGVWDWDLLQDTVYFSPRWKEMHGFQETDELESAEDWSARILPDDRPRVMEKLRAYWQKEQNKFWEEYRIRRKDGTVMWVLDRGVAVWDEQGRVVRMVGSETDITWRKESEEALRRGEHEFYTLADNVPAFFGYLGSDQRYRFVNKRYEELFGLSSNEIMGMTMLQLIGPEAYAKVQPHLEAALTGETVSFEYCLPVPGANERWLSARYVPDRDATGTVGGLFVLLTDITSLKQSEAALRAHEARLSHLSAMLLQAQEDERRRIARELHDDVTQRLAAVAMELGAFSHRQAPAEDQWSKNLGGLREKVERLTNDLQQLAHELHPSILEHVGLEAAVREQADEFAARTGLSVEVVMDELPKSLPSSYATCLYRVLQESLQNVRKHARATNVLVRLLHTGRGVGLCVHDDGRGFAPREAGKGMGGLGLTSMAERLGLVNGEFRIRTKPGDGTEVHAWVPIPNEKEPEVKSVESGSQE